MHDPISTADLVIYAVLILPTSYCTWRHVPHGIVGWIYLMIFCSLRVIGGALSVANSKGMAPKIISSVALSPLLLAATGLLQEIRVRRNSQIDIKLEWVLALVIHIIIGAGIALTAVGISGLSSLNPSGNDITFIKTGLALLTFSWASILLWAFLSLTTPAYRHILLISTVFALMWVGVRVIYTLVAFASEKKSLSPITGTLAVRVGLDLVPEVIATLSFLVGGLLDPPQHQRHECSEHGIETPQHARSDFSSRLGLGNQSDLSQNGQKDIVC